jgi:predicted phosphate transport protein (TIGR00153 family)
VFGILSNDKVFFDVFANMAAKIDQAADLLRNMVTLGDRQSEYAARIKDVEHDCDELTHEVVRKLNSTFITPLDREDIHDLAMKLDDVVDLIDSTADRMVAFGVEATMTEVQDITEILHRQTQVLCKAVVHLGKPDSIMKHCLEIHTLENEADRLFHKGLVRIFRELKDPIKLLKQKEIIEKVEAATDRCEDVANVLEQIMLKNA